MAIFDDTDIQRFADIGEDLLLKDDCDILNDTPGALDAMGGSVHTYPKVATVKSAVVDWRPPSQEWVIANQVVGKVIKKVFLPLGTSVQKSDRLSIKGITYKIIDPSGPSSFTAFTEVICVVTTIGV
jgi:hypothetical protein